MVLGVIPLPWLSTFHPTVTSDHLLQRQTFEKKTCCANKFVSCKILPLLSTLPDKGPTTPCTTPLALDVNTEVLIYYYLCSFWRNWAGQFGNSEGFSPQSVCIVITVFLQLTYYFVNRLLFHCSFAIWAMYCSLLNKKGSMFELEFARIGSQSSLSSVQQHEKVHISHTQSPEKGGSATLKGRGFF